LIRLANCCAWPSSSWILLDIPLEGLDDLLRAHAVGVDRIGDVAHHRLDLHPVRLLEQLDDLLAGLEVVVGEDALRRVAGGGHETLLVFRVRSRS
jgi:hypothetical protein